MQLVEVEAAFKNLKDDLELRPIYHQLEQRIEAHIFLAFLAYCLHVTLRARLRPLAPRPNPPGGLQKVPRPRSFDVNFPPPTARTLILGRKTHPNAARKLLLLHSPHPSPPAPPPKQHPLPAGSAVAFCP